MRLTGDNTIQPEYDPFNTPIPGQSLTDEPGNAPWEHPPKITDPKEALETMWQRMTMPEAVEELLYLLDAGVPVEGIVRTMVFAGFTQGEFTPDLGFVIVEPLMEMVTAIAMRAGIEDLRVSLDDLSNKEFKKNMVQLKTARKEKESMDMLGVPEEQPKLPASSGLLARPGGI